MAQELHSKCSQRKLVWVRLPPGALNAKLVPVQVRSMASGPLAQWKSGCLINIGSQDRNLQGPLVRVGRDRTIPVADMDERRDEPRDSLVESEQRTG